MTALLAWHYRRWRARHYLYAADLDYRRQYTPDALARRIRAARHLAEVEAGHP
jgi:hypothetical protein